MYVVTEDWYFVSHRLQLAVAARDAGYRVSVVTRVRAHRQPIEDAGLRLLPWEHVRGGLNPFREFGTVLWLWRLYRRERPDILHHVALKPTLLGGIAARMAGVPRVINAVAGMGWLYSSGAGLAGMLRPVVRRMMRSVFRPESVTALVQNPDDAAVLGDLGVPAARLRLIAGSGVDTSVFAPAPEPPGEPVVLLPARLLYDKGVGELVQAARLLRARGARFRLVLAGEPDPQNRAAVPPQQLADWVREGIIEHAGHVADMPALLAASHIVCLPSYREGLPRSLLEAAAAGRPIVTTDVPGCREVVQHGVNGLLVPARDPAALAEALSALLMAPALRSEMGRRGRERALREWATPVVVGRMLQLYAEPSVNSLAPAPGASPPRSGRSR